jgi:drug/metabolite transporter (DMT)-like permease
LILAYFFLKEDISFTAACGVVLIVIGTALLAFNTNPKNKVAKARVPFIKMTAISGD